VAVIIGREFSLESLRTVVEIEEGKFVEAPEEATQLSFLNKRG